MRRGLDDRAIRRTAFDFAVVPYSMTRSRRVNTRDGYETDLDNLAGDCGVSATRDEFMSGGQGELGSKVSVTAGLNT